MPLDPRIFAGILIAGALAIAIKLAELYRWHVDQEPVLIDTQTNGGVKTWSGTSQTQP